MTANEIQFTRSISEMSAQELEDARKAGLPLHVQTMARRSRADRNLLVFADVEELHKDRLDEKVVAMEAQGWRKDGVYFVRQKKVSQ